MAKLLRPPGYARQWKQSWSELGWWHSFELPDGSLIRGVHSVDSLRIRLAPFSIAEDLSGKRVLDIGSWDGWFAFEMERRGAEVLAIDIWDNPRFHQMRSILGSKVEYRQLDVYEISPETIGRFDIVLFMGVLYHLKHPLLALEKVCSVTAELAAIDSYILASDLDPNARPVLEFYETDEFEGQTDNWVAPNVACLLAMCRTAGFARVELREILPFGASVACFRKWNADLRKDAPVSHVKNVIHNTRGGINFDSRRDEYLTCFFEAEADNLQLDDLQPQVGAFGVRPIHVKRFDQDTWQINFKLPPGLPPGWHEVSVRTRNGPAGNTRRVAVDVPLPPSSIFIQGVCDGATWKPGQLDLSAGDVLAIWIGGMPENADSNNIRVSLNGEGCTILYVAEATDDEARQVNVRIPSNLDPGLAILRVSLRDQPQSEPAHINVIRR